MAYQNLRAEMARHNVTQTALAEFLECRVATVNAWMQGHDSGFPIKKAVAIKEEFFPGCSIDYLFAEESHDIAEAS